MVILMEADSFEELVTLLRPVAGDLADSLYLAALIDPSRRRDMQFLPSA